MLASDVLPSITQALFAKVLSFNHKKCADHQNHFNKIHVWYSKLSGRMWSFHVQRSASTDWNRERRFSVRSGEKILFSGTCVRIAKRFFYHTLVCMLKQKKAGEDVIECERKNIWFLSSCAFIWPRCELS